MKAYRSIGLVLVVGLIGLLIWAVQASSAGSRFQPIHQVLVIDVGERFVPAPAGRTPALTPAEAFASTANSIRTTHLSPDVSVYLGLLTFSTGGNPPRYVAHHELTYGYAWPPGCADTGFGPPVRPTCKEWTFLDANSGAELDEVMIRGAALSAP